MASLSSMLFFAFCFLFFQSFAGKVPPVTHYRTVELTDILPSASCNRRSPQAKISGMRKHTSLEVINRHGACGGEISKAPTASELFVQDQARVDFIHSKFSMDLKSVDRLRRRSMATKIPAMSITTSGLGSYMVKVGFGIPEQYMSLIFDTGSDLTWTQCQPCHSCYTQQDPVYNPSQSFTYINVTCSSPICSQIESATDEY